MAQRILQALNELSRDLGIPILTPEYEILVALLADGSLGPEELNASSSLSRSGFFHTIDRLKHWQMIACEPDANDRRRKSYSLDPRTAELMIAGLGRFRRYVSYSGPSGVGSDGGSYGRGTRPPAQFRPRWRGDKVPHITCEYQALLYLLTSPGATNGEVVTAVAASPSKCHAALAKLVNDGLVIRADDASDKRRKRYFITEAVRQAALRANRKIVDWLEEIGGTPDAENQDQRLPWANSDADKANRA